VRSLFRPMAVAGDDRRAWSWPRRCRPGRHYPVVSGTSTCSSGQYVINWTVKNSESTQNMTVDVATVTAGTVTGLTGLTGLYAGGASRTAATTLAGTQTGTVTLSVHGTWPDGVKATKTASVVLKGDCKPPVTTTTSSTTTSSTRLDHHVEHVQHDEHEHDDHHRADDDHDRRPDDDHHGRADNHHQRPDDDHHGPRRPRPPPRRPPPRSRPRYWVRPPRRPRPPGSRPRCSAST